MKLTEQEEREMEQQIYEHLKNKKIQKILGEHLNKKSANFGMFVCAEETYNQIYNSVQEMYDEGKSEENIIKCIIVLLKINLVRCKVFAGEKVDESEKDIENMFFKKTVE